MLDRWPSHFSYIRPYGVERSCARVMIVFPKMNNNKTGPGCPVCNYLIGTGSGCVTFTSQLSWLLNWVEITDYVTPHWSAVFSEG